MKTAIYITCNGEKLAYTACAKFTDKKVVVIPDGQAYAITISTDQPLIAAVFVDGLSVTSKMPFPGSLQKTLPHPHAHEFFENIPQSRTFHGWRIADDTVEEFVTSDDIHTSEALYAGHAQRLGYIDIIIITDNNDTHESMNDAHASGTNSRHFAMITTSGNPFFEKKSPVQQSLLDNIIDSFKTTEIEATHIAIPYVSHTFHENNC